jgi:salicylate hydroxylase
VSPRVSVGIAGGGIGGLAAALSLLQRGFDVRVYEQARELSEVGAGIQISPNATRILHRLGLADAFAGLGVRPVAWHQRRWQDGRTLLYSPIGDAVVDAFGFPHYQMHRADVLATLVRALPAECLRVSHRLVAFDDHGDGVTLAFENGESAEVDVLVGADGIHSTVQRLLFGEQRPRFTGCIAYRGLIPAERVAAPEIPVEAQVWLGPTRHFVHYWVQEGRLLNFVGLIDRDTWTRESWTDRGEVADVLAAYEGWHPQVRAILESVEETFIWALFDRAPLEHWSRGRVTLLGDACHPMLPFMAQGSAQAIEDGAALTACLAQTADVPAALRRYETVRLPRASRIQALSARNKIRFHLPDGHEQEERDRQMATQSTDWSIEAVAWIYGHDAGIVEDAAD